MAAPQDKMDRTILDNLLRRIDALETWKRSMLSRTPHMPVLDFATQRPAFPVDGAMTVDYSGSPADLDTAGHVPKYGFGGEWHPFAFATYPVKVTGDILPIGALEGAFKFTVPNDPMFGKLLGVFGAVGEVGSGDTVVQITNRTSGTVTMLDDPITIEAGDYDTSTAGTAPAVDPAYELLNPYDRLWIDILTGSDAIGLQVDFIFGTAT